MAMYVDQPYYEWAHDDVTHQDDSRGVSNSQMLDHGSISFGRFAYESLSWERRSVFTHNKCQEELEKFKCPGLVAKKKAYFEEYYKRIRATKASQENQQTELTLDYGGDESIPSQNGEDEIAKHLGNLREEATIVVDGYAEEPVEISTEKEILEVQNRQPEVLEQEDCIKYPLLIGVSAEKVKEILEVQNGHSDSEAMSINLNSLRSKSEDFELENNAKYPLQAQQWDQEMPDYKSSTRTVEVPERHGCSNLDKEDDSWKNSSTPVEPEGDPEATELAKKVLSEKVANGKAHVPVYRVKEPSATGSKASKSEHKTNSKVVKPSRVPKYAAQRTTEKSGNITGSSKTSLNRISRNIHSFSTAPSHKPLTAVCSSVTIPRPFSFATDRQAAVLSGNKKAPVKSDYKASNKTTSLTVHKKDAANVQASSKKSIRTPGAQNRVLENKRCHEERMRYLPLDKQPKISSSNGTENRTKVHLREDGQKEASSKKTIRTTGAQDRVLENKRCHEERKKPLPLDKQHISLKDRGANVPGHPKTRSINVPPRNNSTSSNGTGKRTKVHLREDGRKEILPSSTTNHLIKARNLRSSEQSLGTKKPKQEKPPWR